MNRSVFFDAVRARPFGGRLTAGQVAGMEAVLDGWAGRGFSDARWLAYMLATAFHETARTMRPIREYGSHAYFMRMYDMTGDRPHVARDLGNTLVGDGARFCGRGYVQLTGRANYARMSDLTGRDLVGDPDLALEPGIAAEVMFAGMTRGLFTGRALHHYFGDAVEDWAGARRIVNGTDRAATIAGYGQAFHAAVVAGGGAVVRPPGGPHPDPPPQGGRERGRATLLDCILAFLRAVLTGGRP